MDVPVCRVQIRRIHVGRRGVSRILLVMRDWYVVLQSAMCLVTGAHRYAGCEAAGLLPQNLLAFAIRKHRTLTGTAFDA